MKLTITHALKSARTGGGRGFTLIELMVVVSIIGILASIAMPAYLSYITRAQVVEAMVIADELKGQVKEFYKQKGTFPADNKEAGLPAPELLLGNYVTRVALEEGAFQITLGNKANNLLKDKILTLRPAVVTDSPVSPFSWLCGNSPPVKGMTAIGPNRTSVTPALLPVSCRDL
ncbi:MAG: pilin [Hahellaceae bacterium]|nr:pilin [Hahellaceae bacterium]MCP5168202.1 pilin [Hahellaceae bacterium]